MKDKKAFETTKGPKAECRQSLVKAIWDECKLGNPRILTLPSREHLCYNALKEKFKNANIVCLEKDTAIARDLNAKGITTEPTDTTTYLQGYHSWQDPFDAIFLDYYSYFNDLVLRDLHLIAQSPNIGNKNGFVLALTLSKAIRGGKGDIELLLNSGLATRQDEVIGCDLDSISAYIAETIFSKWRVSVLEQKEYKADARKKSMTMQFMLFYIYKR